jgi:hypothetical protein
VRYRIQVDAMSFLTNEAAASDVLWELSTHKSHKENHRKS